MREMTLSYRSHILERSRGLLLALFATSALLLAVDAILINPSLEDHYTFGVMQGPTDYSFFAEHPPVLSEDEEFLLVLSTFCRSKARCRNVLHLIAS